MTKFINKSNGVILEPKSEIVADQLQKNPLYTVYDGADDGKNDNKGGEKALNKMNRDELLAAAQAAGIEVPEGATKKEIVELIQANSGNA